MGTEARALDNFLKGYTKHLQINDFIFYKEDGKIVGGPFTTQDHSKGKAKFNLIERFEIDDKKIMSINQIILNECTPKDLLNSPTAVLRKGEYILGYRGLNGQLVQEQTSNFTYEGFVKEMGHDKKYQPIVTLLSHLNESGYSCCR